MLVLICITFFARSVYPPLTLNVYLDAGVV